MYSDYDDDDDNNNYNDAPPSPWAKKLLPNASRMESLAPKFDSLFPKSCPLLFKIQFVFLGKMAKLFELNI